MHWRLFSTQSHPFMLNLVITEIFSLPITAFSYKISVRETCLQHHWQHYKAKRFLFKSCKSLCLLNLLYPCTYRRQANSSRMHRQVSTPLSQAWQPCYHARFLHMTKHTGTVYCNIIDQMSCGSHDQASCYCRIFKLFLRNSLKACKFLDYLHCRI